MTGHTLLGIRVSRRGLATVALQDGAITFHDGRHLTSRRDRVAEAVTRYTDRVLAQLSPERIVLYAPCLPDSATSRVRAVLVDRASAANVPVSDVSAPTLFGAFGIARRRTRRELHDTVRTLWPEASSLSGALTPYVLEAAAVALQTEVVAALSTDQ